MQKLPKKFYEVIVIDNCPLLPSDYIAHYFKREINIKYFLEKKEGLSYARNKGCLVAKAPYLVYIDDDAILPAHYLNSISSVIKKFKPDILGGPVYPYYTQSKPLWFQDKYGIKKYENKSGFSRNCSITGANYVIKKSILLKMGLFDTQLGMKGEDIGIGEERKILDQYRTDTPSSRQKVYYSLNSYVKHYMPKYKMSFIYLLKRSFIAGQTWGRLSRNKFKLIYKIIYAYFWILSTPLILSYIIIKEIITKSFSQADYLKIILNHSCKLGFVSGILK